MMQASKMSLIRQGASWLWWAWTAVPCSPRPGHYGNKAANKGAGALRSSCRLAKRPPAAGKEGPKSIDGPMIGKISTPCRLRDQASDRASSPS